MILIFFGLLSLTIALLRTRNVTWLKNLELKQPWLILTALLLQVMIFSPLGSRFSLPVPYIYIFSYFLIIFFIILNINIKSFIIIGTGMLSNFLAITANGGYMPAKIEHLQYFSSPETIELLKKGMASNNSIMLTEHSKLSFLADIYYLPPDLPLANVFSIGDVIIAAGAFILFQELSFRKEI
ncbi:MAG: hypothetical protein C4589_00095 [Peptococcaceae bacterium]|jgi:hypothetical protein|nr:MAG: hypothetical protein C4589_00095 [Peptococcaceae bacterium]